MPGERIKNNESPTRPEGAKETDFGELSDYTITEIATSPAASQVDRANAEAEIYRREQAGAYDFESSDRDLRKDLLGHGYGVKDGMILYPTDEYRAWLASDRSEPAPTSQRETIRDRLKNTRNDVARGNLVATATAEIQDEIDKYLDDDAKAPVSTERKVSNLDLRRKERKLGEKAVSEERSARRNFKETNKYDNIYSNSEKMARAEAIADFPNLEVNSNPNTESSRTAFESALDKVNFRLKKTPTEDYFIEGALKNLADGHLAINPQGFILDGFNSIEKTSLEHNLSEDEKSELAKTIRYDILPDKISDWQGEDAVEKTKSAEHEALIAAISSGAYLERAGFSSPAKVKYNLPIFEHGDGALQSFMAENGVNIHGTEAELASYDGFASIIEAIKDLPDETAKGFEALDWYVDNFEYVKHFKEFEDFIDGYQETADYAWKLKYEDYLNHLYAKNPDLKNRPEAKVLPTIKDVVEITEDELFEGLNGILDLNESNTVRVKKRRVRKPRHPGPDILGPNGPREPSVRNNPPTSYEKYVKIVSEYIKLRKMDSSANAYKAIFTDGNGAEKQYRVLRFGDTKNGYNIAIAAPIEAASSDASFVFVGETGDNRDGWIDAFQAAANKALPASKKDLRADGTIFAHNHVAALKTKGLGATDNMWDNIWRDILSRTVAKKSA